MRAGRLVLFGWLVGIALCGVAHGQSLVDCSGINQTAGPKVVVDKLEYQGEAGETQILTNEYKMEFLLELLSRLGNLFPDTQPRPVLCANRAPKPDGSDFIPALVRTLNNREVLLEVWGTIKAGKRDGKQALGGSIFMMIIPVRHYEGSSAQLDFHLLAYPKKERGDLETASMEMAFGTEFDVYASIAQGIKELKNHSYDKAKKYLANARIQWEKALEEGSLARTATDQHRILEYIKNLEEKTTAAAAADLGYRGDMVAVEDLLEERGR